MPKYDKDAMINLLESSAKAAAEADLQKKVDKIPRSAGGGRSTTGRLIPKPSRAVRPSDAAAMKANDAAEKRMLTKEYNFPTKPNDFSRNPNKR